MQSYQPDSTPTPLIAFVQPLGIGLVIALAFVLTYLLALHKPTPHDLPVGVVAAPAAVAEYQRTISARTGDAIALRPVADGASARQQIEDGKIVAAYLPDQGGRLLLAGAHGPAVSQAVTGVFTGVAAGQGSPLRAEDIVPLTAEDPRGLSGFYLLFGLTLAGFIFGQTSHMYSKSLSLGRRLVQALLFAVLTGTASTVIAGPLLAVTPGPFLVITTILTVLALVIALITMACTRLIGDPGIALSTLLLVILGNATSGGAVSAYFLPDGFRQLTPVLPPGAATRALADVAYFDSSAALGPLAVLAAWGAGALLLLVAANRRRTAPSRPATEQLVGQRG